MQRRINLRTVICAIPALMAIATTSPALASSQDGLISDLGANQTGSVAFVLNGTRTAKPACATDAAWAVPISTTSDRLVAMVVTAKAMGKGLSVVGTGACGAAQPTREEVSYINQN